MYDKAMPSEVQDIKAAMHKATDTVEQRRLQVKLSRLQHSLKRHEDRTLEMEVHLSHNS